MSQQTQNTETALSFKRMAILLQQLEYIPHDTAIALKETYPGITALQMATVLIEVFQTPPWQKEQLLRLLNSISNSEFTELQIQNAIASLFPEDKSKPGVKIKPRDFSKRRLGAKGRQNL